MKASNQKVIAALRDIGLDLEITLLADEVRTAKLAAAVLGCQVSQIANSLIFRNLDNDEAVLIMSAGGSRVDLARVTAVTGLRLAKADADFVRSSTGFAIGGVPPLAHKVALKTLLDEGLQKHQQIWAAAGTPESIFSMSPAQLQQMTAGVWLDISQTSA